MPDPTPCAHERITTASAEGLPSLWYCDDCRRRFYPACETCVDVGHRNETHPQPAPEAGLREPCGYCGSVDGLTPPTVSLSDPMSGETLRRLIDEVTGGLSDPRLHEVDWGAVAALAGSVDPGPDDQTVAEYVLEMMLEFQRMYGQLRKVPTEAVRMMLVKAATGRFVTLAAPAPDDAAPGTDDEHAAWYRLGWEAGFGKRALDARVDALAWLRDGDRLARAMERSPYRFGWAQSDHRGVRTAATAIIAALEAHP